MTMMMLHLLFNIILTITAFVGFLFNVYILISVGITKQIFRPGNFFLLHMSLVFTLVTLIFLCFSTPAIFLQEPAFEEQPQPLSSYFVGRGGFICGLQTASTVILHPLALWTIAGVHLDRFISIAYPLRYSAMISFRKSAIFMMIAWLSVITVSIPPLFVSSSMEMRPDIGGCSLYFLEGQSSHNHTERSGGRPSQSWILAGSAIYYLVAILVPILIVVGFNFRIVRIAKYHQYRIANALFGLTPSMGTAAQQQLSEGAKARKRQMDALKRFEGANAVGTLAHLVGSLFLFYVPFYGILCVYESMAGKEARPVPLKISLIILMASPIFNSFLFGIRNKSVQMTLINYARKEFYKNEVQKEIRQRSPGLGGSNRPSVSSIMGQITCQVPYLQRHLSEISLQNTHNGHSYSMKRRISQSTAHVERTAAVQASRDHKPISRHVSDLSWRVASGFTTGRMRRSESSETLNECQRRKRQRRRRFSKNSLEVPASFATFGKLDDSFSDDDISYDEQEAGVLKLSDASDEIPPQSVESNESDWYPTSSRKQSVTSISLCKGPNHSAKQLSNAIRNIWQGSMKRHSTAKGPKITITKVPSIDQTSLEFMHPFKPSACGEQTTIVYLEGNADAASTSSFIQRELRKSASVSKEICDRVILHQGIVIVHAEDEKADDTVTLIPGRHSMSLELKEKAHTKVEFLDLRAATSSMEYEVAI